MKRVASLVPVVAMVGLAMAQVQIRVPTTVSGLPGSKTYSYEQEDKDTGENKKTVTIQSIQWADVTAFVGFSK